MDLVCKQQQIIARYLLIESPVERLEAIMSRGRRWPEPDLTERTSANLIRGCTSRIWMVMRMEQGCCRFFVAAEAPLVRGLACLLCELYDGESSDSIAAFEPELIAPLGLDSQISLQRQHGFSEIRRAIRDMAALFR